MFRLGVAGKKGCAPLHSSQFNPDERSIKVAVILLTQAIVNLNK